MGLLRNRFTSISAGQHSKLKRQLDRLHRQTAKAIKTRVKVAKSELAQCDYSRILSNAKNALVAYSTAIIGGATRGADSVSTTDKCLARQKAACAQGEKRSRSSNYKKEDSEFSEFLSGLLRRVDRCFESHLRSESSEPEFLEGVCSGP